MKKCIYSILILITIIGAIIIAVKGLNVGITYGKNVRVDVFVGKEFNNEDVKKIAQEVFETNTVSVQKIEYYGDIAAITISPKAAENIDAKLENLNAKINEKYETEGKKDDIKVTHYPKTKLSSVIAPYILPIAISTITIIIYALIRYRKLNLIKVMLEYVANVVLTQTTYLGIIAIARIPISKLIIPIGLLLYVIAFTVTTIIEEKQLAEYSIKQNKK